VKDEWVCVTDRNASVAAIRYRFAGREYKATGSSKREKGDAHNPRIGQGLAAARAFRDLADQMEADAMALVREAERVRRARADARARRADAVGRASAERSRRTIKEIREKYGPEAAERARQRRSPGTWADEPDEEEE
jgi:hypothetical protein